VSQLMAVGYVNAVRWHFSLCMAKSELIACQIRSQLLNGNREETLPKIISEDDVWNAQLQMTGDVWAMKFKPLL
jgi:hypothetical protein